MSDHITDHRLQRLSILATQDAARAMAMKGHTVKEISRQLDCHQVTAIAAVRWAQMQTAVRDPREVRP